MFGGKNESPRQLLLASNTMIDDYNDALLVCEAVLNHNQEQLDQYLGDIDSKVRTKATAFIEELRSAIACEAWDDDVAVPAW